MNRRESCFAAIREVERLLKQAEGTELDVLLEFDSEFSALIEGWQMRIKELENDDCDDE